MSRAPIIPPDERQNNRHRLVNHLVSVQTTRKHRGTVVGPRLRNSQHPSTTLPTSAASSAVGAGRASSRHAHSALLLLVLSSVTCGPARTTVAAVLLRPLHRPAPTSVPRNVARTGGGPFLPVAFSRSSTRCACSSLAMGTAGDRGGGGNGSSSETATAAAAPPTGEKKKRFPPSRFTVDDDGKRWRLCAGAAVLNSSNHLLVGERVHVPGSWQAPQGGVDDVSEEFGRSTTETIDEASRRELYEEVGLEVGRNVVVERAADEGNVGSGVRYETTGTSSWLTRSGFAGQELHWTVYRCSDARGDEDPSAMCDLSGKGGEHAEFSNVKWAPIEEVLEGMWPAKRSPYEALRDLILGTVGDDVGLGRRWEERCAELDLSGRWTRDASRSEGVVEGLVARGMGKDDAVREAGRPYVQSWRRDAAAGDDEEERSSPATTAWMVTTFADDGVTPRRSLRYPLGRWEESYHGDSAVFGSAPSPGGEPVVVKRRTAFVAESEGRAEGDGPTIAHATLSDTPLGVEEARRYLIDMVEGPAMVLRRTFWPKNAGGDGKGQEGGSTHDDATKAVVSTEIFVREE